jgi:ABC-type transporter Mla maintaining outer membrane lipid asymmetry ATPase subunit MlaF
MTSKPSSEISERPIGAANTPVSIASDIHVRLRAVGMRFGDNTVLRDIDLDVRRGQLAVIIGGSGTGKTTLLRIKIGRAHV